MTNTEIQINLQKGKIDKLYESSKVRVDIKVKLLLHLMVIVFVAGIVGFSDRFMETGHWIFPIGITTVTIIVCILVIWICRARNWATRIGCEYIEEINKLSRILKLHMSNKENNEKIEVLKKKLFDEQDIRIMKWVGKE